MLRTDEGWRTARKTWMCSCPCGRPDHIIPAGDRYFVCDGIRYCAECAHAHVAGPCAELLARGAMA